MLLFLTICVAHQAWVETQRRALRKPPKPIAGLPKNVVRRTMALIIEGASFQWFMFLTLGKHPWQLPLHSSFRKLPPAHTPELLVSTRVAKYFRIQLWGDPF
jgi:hypothetical protein